MSARMPNAYSPFGLASPAYDLACVSKAPAPNSVVTSRHNLPRFRLTSPNTPLAKPSWCDQAETR